MNKIIVKILVVAAALMAFASCKLDRGTQGLTLQKPWESILDADKFHSGLYASFRALEAPGSQSICDLQSPIYNMVQADGNIYEPFYKWSELSLTADDGIAAYYGGYYDLIMQTNYFEMRAKEVLDNQKELLSEKKFQENDLKVLAKWIAEAKVLRAHAYYRLLSRFTYRYGDRPEQGLPLLDKYELNPQNPQVSQDEIYDYALRILDEAIAEQNFPAVYDGPLADGIPQEMPKNFAHATKARLLLEKRDYDGVINAVQQFIGDYNMEDISSKSEAEKREAVGRIYRTEDSKEIMWKLYASAQIGGSRDPYSGAIFYQEEDLKTTIYLTDIVPSQYVLDLYNMDGGASIEDVRASIYVKNQDPLHQIGQGTIFRYEWNTPKGPALITVVGKFDGNPALDLIPGIPSFRVSTHAFNIAEGYLMLAEAYAFKSSPDQGNALNALNTLRAARGISSPIDAGAIGSADELRELVKRERLRELIGEGRHFTDLKRWGDAFDRAKMGQPQKGPNGEVDYLYGFLKMNLKDMVIPYDSNDAMGKMFAWEFPHNDLITNKNIKPNWKR